MYIKRNIAAEILDALSTSPVVLLNGARQTGKSTLARKLAVWRNYEYFTLDDFTVLNAVLKDPVAFLSNIKKPVIIDEVQRAVQLFPAIKIIVDNNRIPGQFLLTGSANVFMLPRLSESLAGRMEIISLWPFSCDELNAIKGNFIDCVFNQELEKIRFDDTSRDMLLKKIFWGGYPEIQKISVERRRNAWFNSYLTTILQRDVKDISRIEGVHEFPRLLSLLASRSGSLLNMSNLSRNMGMVMMTLKRYLAILAATFLVRRLPAWFRNVGKRLIKMPKIYLNDSGLLAYLLGINMEQLSSEPQIAGQLLESFVMQELSKQASWSNVLPQVYFYRSTAGREVDFVLENRSGYIVGIEVKMTDTVTSQDFKGLDEMAKVTGKNFLRGIVLYTGSQMIPFGKNLFAVPVNVLWQTGREQDAPF